MGGANATSEALCKGGLISRILENLNGLHGPPYRPTGDDDRDAAALRDRLYEYNKTRFFDEFSYPYRRDQSRPERWNRQSEVIGKDGYVSFPIEQMNQVRMYIENRVLQASDLPEKEKDDFKSDVMDMIQSLIMTDSNGFQADEFVRTYGDLRVEGMIIWDVINAPDPSGNNPNAERLMVLHYAGVMYSQRK